MGNRKQPVMAGRSAKTSLGALPVLLAVFLAWGAAAGGCGGNSTSDSQGAGGAGGSDAGGGASAGSSSNGGAGGGTDCSGTVHGVTSATFDCRQFASVTDGIVTNHSVIGFIPSGGGQVGGQVAVEIAFKQEPPAAGMYGLTDLQSAQFSFIGAGGWFAADYDAGDPTKVTGSATVVITSVAGYFLSGHLDAVAPVVEGVGTVDPVMIHADF